jgi:hypothetical protein
MTRQERVLRGRLDDWLDVLKAEVQALTINRHIFWEIQDIISANPRIHLGSNFYEWMGSAYASSMAVGIRRQIDEDHDSISFVNFLKKIQACPRVVSRQAYTELFAGGNYPARWADSCFDHLAARGRANIDPAQVTSEIQTLKDRTEHVRKYVNRRVAHRDRRNFRPIPKFQDIDSAVEYLDDLTVRYLNLFRGISMTTVLPTWQYDWKEIFRYPWINP